MIKNYLKVAWRNIRRNRIYAAINVFGLALGICACIVIFLICQYEFSFDNFHKDKDRIYRIMGDLTQNSGQKLHFGKLPAGVSQTAAAELTGFHAVAGVMPYNAEISVPGEAKATKRTNNNTVIVQPQYFEIFKYQWLAGNESDALNGPFKVVLTENEASLYFGNKTADELIGRQIVYNDSLKVTVSGIIKDWNKNTDLGFTDFISAATLKSSFLKKSINTDAAWEPPYMNTWTFVKLSAGTKPAQINSEMVELVKRHGAPNTKLKLWLQAITDIHFDGDVIENPVRTADKPTLYSLIIIALFILILAVINFINLSTAQSLQRSKEVGVRKVLGSSRTSLIFQFLTETTVLVLFSVSLAVLLVKPTLNGFYSFMPPGVTFNFLSIPVIVFLTSITIVTSLLAGLYPAKVLSSYLPVQTLKGASDQKGGEKWLLRKGLIVFQFSVSLIFIISGIIMANQLRYVRQTNPGFNADAIINVDTPGDDSLSKVKVIAQEIRQLKGVSTVGLQWVPPQADNGRGRSIKFNTNEAKSTGVVQIAGDENFIPLYHIKLLAGRNIMHADSMREFVINETLSRLMGCKSPADAVGKILYWDGIKPYPVVGVVADFHTRSFHEIIAPLCLVNRPNRERTLAVKLASAGKHSDEIKASLAQIQQLWKQMYPQATFKYQFYDETLTLLYQRDQRTATLINTAITITIFISCIGLFGLALFTAEKRAKEISIRKILGASASNIAVMLSTDFVILVVIALVIASPVACYFMNRWLLGFAYHIDITLWVFILAGLAAIVISLATVSFQAIKAALANPVKSLRSE